ncbi:MAG: DUF2345 domain-containing protein, partial [Shewanella oncorhynchi]
QLQAQSDDIELTADKNARLTAIKGKSLFNAKQEILLTAGGAYIRIKGGKIELHAPGKVSIKGGSHDWGGPQSLNQNLAQMPKSKPPEQNHEQFVVKDKYSGLPMAYQTYQIKLADGSIVHGITDKNGKTERVYTKAKEQIKLILD